MIKKATLSLILVNQLFAVSDVSIMDLKETVYILMDDVKRTEKALDRNSLLVDVRTTDILKKLKEDTEIDIQEELRRDKQIRDVNLTSTKDFVKTRELIAQSNVDINDIIATLSAKIDKRVKELNEKIDINQQNTLSFIKSTQKKSDEKLEKIMALLQESINSSRKSINDTINAQSTIIKSKIFLSTIIQDINDTDDNNSYLVTDGNLTINSIVTDDESNDTVEDGSIYVDINTTDEADNGNLEVIQVIE